MKMAMAFALLCGLLVDQGVNAREPKIQRPHWIIIATIIDWSTDEQLKHGKLPGPELVFDDPRECKSIVDAVHLIPNEHVDVVLTCQKVGPEERFL
jgi:hypothetical protein